jgi:predicted secreted protein
MNWFFGVAIYFVIWWLSLLIVIPFFGSHSQQDEGEKVMGTVSSAPAKYRILKVFGATTLFACFIFGIWYVASIYFGFSFESIPQFYPDYR